MLLDGADVDPPWIFFFGIIKDRYHEAPKLDLKAFTCGFVQGAKRHITRIWIFFLTKDKFVGVERIHNTLSISGGIIVS